MNPTIHMLPESFVCPCCEAQMEWQASITGPENAPITKGQIIVCANCSAVLQVGDSALVKMSKRQVRALSSSDKSILKMTVASVLAHRMQSGGNVKGN